MKWSMVVLQVSVGLLVCNTLLFAAAQPIRPNNSIENLTQIHLRKTSCAACGFLVMQYNNVRSDLFHQNHYLIEMEEDKVQAFKNLQRVEMQNGYLKSIYIRQPSPALEQQINWSDGQLAAYTHLYARQKNEIVIIDGRYHDLHSQLNRLCRQISECESMNRK